MTWLPTKTGPIDVFTSFAGFYSVRNALEAAGFKGDDAEIVMLPTTSAELDLEGAEKVLKLIDMLEDLDDVQKRLFQRRHSRVSGRTARLKAPVL